MPAFPVLYYLQDSAGWGVANILDVAVSRWLKQARTLQDALTRARQVEQ